MGRWVGVGRVSMCCMLGGRGGQILEPSCAGPCVEIESLCFEPWTSQWGWTALIRAAWSGHCDVVGLLLDRGADIEAKDSVSHHNSR